MKFLCVACNEAMKLTRTAGPDEGSMTVVFTCPACGRETAMLTNIMETQMVRSLGVNIGGKNTAAEPMELVRKSLASGHAAAPEDASSPAETAGSKCPFTGVIADAFAKHGGPESLVWTQAARERIARIPEFAQPMVKKGVEMHALENGYTEIDDAVVDEVKSRFGM